MEFLVTILILFPSVVLHECAHGWTAFRLGDPTAKMAGRLTVNPLKHIDPIGTIILPGILLALKVFGYSSVVVGWAKPVPVNFNNLSHPQRDTMLVAMAGPLVNVFVAVSASLLLKIPALSGAVDIISAIILVNLVLAVFNLIPIPPLDGSRLISWFLPRKIAYYFSQLEGVGIFIVIVLLSYFNLFEKIVWPIVSWGAQRLGVRV